MEFKKHVVSIEMPNSLTKIRVSLDIFETKLGIVSHSEPNYFIVKAQVLFLTKI